MLSKWLEKFAVNSGFREILDAIRSNKKETQLSGLDGSAKTMMIAALHKKLEVPLVVVTHQLHQAQKIVDDLREWLTPEQVLLYPINEVMATELSLASTELLEQRVATLVQLSASFSGVLVVPFAGLRRLLPPREQYASASFSVRRGLTFAMQSLKEKLIEIGYEHVQQVENKGEFSVRGGIVDLFPVTSLVPYRLEFFDDEIDSIRTFEPETQRSLASVEELSISPCREWLADPERFRRAAGHAREWLNRTLATLTDMTHKRALKETLSEEIEWLEQQQSFPAVYKYMSLLYPEKKTLLSYLDQRTVMVLDDPLRVLDVAKQMDYEEQEWRTELMQAGKLVPALNWSIPSNEVWSGHSLRVLYNSHFMRSVPNARPAHLAQIHYHPIGNFYGQMNLLRTEVARWRKNGNKIVFMAATGERMERMRRTLYDEEIEYDELVSGNIHSGFELPGSQLVVVTEGELFHQRQRKVRATEVKRENGLSIKSYKELNVGDYVVHVHHGIGQYIGIGTIEIEGVHKDFLHINYAGGNRLSVPIDQIQLIQKYMGNDDRAPKVHRLGGAEWSKARSRARSSAKDIADELIKLYAERQARQGYAFSQDTPMQLEFESLFQYDDTHDQRKSSEEIKADMELSRPMDRLLCGDVGYGKTEVAIRAAFKAVTDNKQVAMLVPTTILAQQHFKTFSERFADFPINIEVLSRFRSSTEIKNTMEKMRKGTVDIVIGTHRLLSKDVQFKDLGLLIVDEEQRFGVSHKEKLKKFRSNVDVLTLTATPIPRTLHMSLIGVRDLSVIETPPENRLPVQTYVVEHSFSLARDVIERELGRGGQVFYMYNRVNGMESIVERLQVMLPDVRIAMAHGQMPEHLLERTILDFLEGEYDVLVSTSIIESGVDIPNVNTLIVHDADKLGLSQLYQLRGRVGRSAGKIAYAYFTYARNKVLTEVAEQRLSAIKQFTELGSGFKIAMRDLSIRGAGNLLGAEQSGFIASVGFEMYTQMLAEEIEQRKQELFPDSNGKAAVTERPTPEIKIVIDAYLPSDYIYDSKQKIEIYKRVAAVESLQELEELQDELEDRFGKLHPAVHNLLKVAKLRWYGTRYGFQKITHKSSQLVIHVAPSQNDLMDTGLLMDHLRRHQGALKQISSAESKHKELHFLYSGLAIEQVLERLEPFLQGFENVLIRRGETAHA